MWNRLVTALLCSVSLYDSTHGFHAVTMSRMSSVSSSPSSSSSSSLSSSSTTTLGSHSQAGSSEVGRRAFMERASSATASVLIMGSSSSSGVGVGVGVGNGWVPSAAAAEGDDDGFTTTESGLKYKVVKPGNGTVPPSGTTVRTQYTGWLDGFDSPRKFDSSRDRGRTFNFRVGSGQVIRGWEESFGSMSIGERRLIIVPSKLGYGDRGAGGIIPPGATLYFDVELVGTL